MTDNPPDLDLADRIIELMNDALKLDPRAITDLICHRVPCNEALAEHPTIQVGRLDRRPDEILVGMLGVLNGLCGVYGPEGIDGHGKFGGYGPISCGEIVRDDPSEPIQIGRFFRTDIRAPPTEAEQWEKSKD